MKKIISKFSFTKFKKNAFTLVELPVVRKRAFTLVELMVIIVIIGLISTVVLVNMAMAKNKAKDAKVKAEMSAFRDAIMSYKLDNVSLTEKGYTNACSKTSVSTIKDKFVNPDCRSDQTRWAFTAKLPSAGTAAYPAICMDSTGVTKVYTDQAVGVSASFTCTTNEAEIAEAAATAAAIATAAELERVAATPTFSHPAGQYFQGQPVTISSSRVGSTIYYTTNNTAPTTTSFNQASTPLVITANMTVRAIAVMTGVANSPEASVYYTILGIGSPYRGGKIAYFLTSSDPGYDSSVKRGFIASVSDVSPGIQWGCTGSNFFTVGAYGLGIGDGLTNTAAIVSKCGSGTAATVAANYSVSYAGGTNADWYLPSYGELNKILNTSARTLIGNFDVSSGWTNYWTSSQASYGIWFFNRQWNDPFTPDPNSWGTATYRVRPISYF